jgi:hypothetical protein
MFFKHMACLILSALVVAGCGPKEKLAVSVKEGKAVTPIDYVLLVDNSGSIRGYEQRLVREAIKLFIDLCDATDRVSILAFGSGAEIAGSSTITDAASRKSLQSLVDSKIDFRHPYSDIRAAMQLLSDRKEELYRPSGTMRAAIVFSDGFLETPDRKDGQAYQQIVALKDSKLFDIVFFSLGLGKETMDKVISGTSSATGRVLLRDVLPGSTGNFREIKEVSALAGSFVDIIKETKQLPDVFEKPTPVFVLDSAIRSATLIVPKRNETGQRLFEEPSLELRDPAGEAVTIYNKAKHPGIEWISSYESVELIKLSSSLQGKWTLQLTKGDLPPFFMMVRTPLELRADVLPRYFENQDISFTPTICDRRTGKPAQAGYLFSAKIDGKESRAETSIDGVLKVAATGLSQGRHQLRFYATDSTQKQFFRVSPNYDIGVVPAVLEFGIPPTTLVFMVPFITKPLSCSVRVLNPDYSIIDPMLRVAQANGKGDICAIDTMKLSPAAQGFSTQKGIVSGGRYLLQVRCVIRDKTNAEYPVASPVQKCRIVDLRLACWALMILFAVWLVLFIIAKMTTFSFTAVARKINDEGEETDQKTVTHSRMHNYTFSSNELLGAKVSVKLYNTKLYIIFVTCSKRPWMECQCPPKTKVGGLEYTKPVKISTGLELRIPDQGGFVRIQFRDVSSP